MKRSYLYRLISVILIVLLVPVCIFLFVFLEKSVKQINQSNEQYNSKIVNTSILLIDEMISEMKEHVGTISSESKKAESLLLRGADNLKQDYYKIYLVAEQFNRMKLNFEVDEWGVYFYTLERAIEPSKSFSDFYFRSELKNKGFNEGVIEELLDLQEYKWMKPRFYTTNTKNNIDGNLLIAFCTNIGTNVSSDSSKALVYFIISPENMGNSMVTVNDSGVAFYLLDDTKEEILLSWGNKVCVHADVLLGLDEYESDFGIKRKVLYERESNTGQYSIYAYLSESSIYNSLIEFVHNVGIIMIVAGFTMMICCILAVYIAYKPINDLVLELDSDEEGDLLAVKSTIEKNKYKIIEQEMLIMDLLLEHLLHGVHISSKRMIKLGVSEDTCFYCVFTLDYYRSEHEISQLISSVGNTLKIRLFAMELDDGDGSVFIAFMKNSEIDDLVLIFEEWMKEYNIEACKLHVGKVVDKLDDIQKSFRSCQKKSIADNQEGEGAKEEKEKKRKEAVLEFIEMNYKNANLSQVEVADYFQMSSYTLSRLFKKSVGIGFHEYLTSKRLECAKELLITSEYSINKVAIMSGFSSRHYFSRIFKAYEGVSPSEFRGEQ